MLQPEFFDCELPTLQRLIPNVLETKTVHFSIPLTCKGKVEVLPDVTRQEVLEAIYAELPTTVEVTLYDARDAELEDY